MGAACEWAAIGNETAQQLYAGKNGFVAVLIIKAVGLVLDIYALIVTYKVAIEYTGYLFDEDFESDEDEKYYHDTLNFLSFYYISYQRLILVGYIMYKLFRSCFICGNSNNSNSPNEPHLQMHDIGSTSGSTCWNSNTELYQSYKFYNEGNE